MSIRWATVTLFLVPLLGCTSCASRLPPLEKNKENLKEPNEQKLLNTGLDKGQSGETLSTQDKERNISSKSFIMI